MNSQAQLLEESVRRGNEPLRVAIENLTIALAESSPNIQINQIDVPLWTQEQATEVCDITGWAVGAGHRVPLEVDGAVYEVHPNVRMYLEQNTLPDDEVFDHDYPEELSTVPTTTTVKVSRVKQSRPQERIGEDWGVDDLADMKRPQLYMAAKQVGLNDKLKAKGLDYRKENNAWLMRAVAAMKNGSRLPSVESDANRAVVASAKPDPEPGPAKGKPMKPKEGKGKKKAQKKADESKKKPKPKPKPKKAAEKPKKAAKGRAKKKVTKKATKTKAKKKG